MMILNDRPDEKRISDIRALYFEAFPKSEQKPFSLILEKAERGEGELISIESEGGEFLGLAITLCYKDILLLDYFAIRAELRGGGIGGEAIELLIKRYADRRFILETEDPDEEGADNREMRMRRLGFYLRHGLRETEWRIMLFGVKMRVLCGGRAVTFEEYHEIFEKLFSEKIATNLDLAE